jgi:hypothetical protein
MSGAIPSFPRYAFMAWCSVKAQRQLYLYLTTTTASATTTTKGLSHYYHRRYFCYYYCCLIFGKTDKNCCDFTKLRLFFGVTVYKIVDYLLLFFISALLSRNNSDLQSSSPINLSLVHLNIVPSICSQTPVILCF